MHPGSGELVMLKSRPLVPGVSFALLAATGPVLRAIVVFAQETAQEQAGAVMEEVVVAAEN